jgi:hypothetical protein
LSLAGEGIVHAQDNGGRMQIKTNPFGWFAGQFQVSVEKPFSKHASWQLTSGIVRSNLELNTSDLESLLGVRTSLNSVDWLGFVVMPEVRYYLSPEVMKGFYFGGFARVRAIQRTMVTNFTGVQRRTAVGAGFVLGGQFQMGKRVRGDLFLGPQVKSVTTNIGEHFVYGEEGWIPGIRFGMNIAWTR